jgi:acetylornithine/succinyldiaminopimelate/putrescine aminotransferase/predicted amino acid dehydrogenase
MPSTAFNSNLDPNNPTPTSTRGANDYRRHVRPRVAQMLEALRMDVCFHRADGNWLTYDHDGREIRVFDALGGYGSTFFGHNHPALTDALIDSLRDKRPFAAQASIRTQAARLAVALSDLFHEATGKSAVVTFGNSGAETVEAAWKHAVLEYRKRRSDDLARIRRVLRTMGDRVASGKVTIGEASLRDCARLLGTSDAPSYDDVQRAILQVAEAQIEATPTKLSLVGAFHGKTGSALQLTHAEYHWAAFGQHGDSVDFVDPFAPNAEQQLETAVKRARMTYFVPVAENGELRLRETHCCKIAALFYEPIQGEGGIRQMPRAFLHAARRLADENGFALVADEIQCGMGRTGRFFASEHVGVAPDYVVLAKSLGGGLAKIGALLVSEDRYVEEFGLLHSSTFAEDDHSSSVALRALALLSQEGLQRRADRQGSKLLAGLKRLCKRFPNAFSEARGRGLMLGIELKALDRSQSPLARALSAQGLLGYLASGFMLHHGRLRVAPSLSSPHTLRLEPSAYITDDEILHILETLAVLGRVLSDQDYGALLEFSTLETRPELGTKVISRNYAARSVAFYLDDDQQTEARRVAFFGHFISVDDLPLWEPSLAHLSLRSRRVLLDRVAPLIDPHPILQRRITDARGQAVDLTFIGVPHDSAKIERSMRERTTAPLVEQLQRAVDLAEDLGCQVIGLGGYTSIVSRNGKALSTRSAQLSTGNSLTSAVTLQALLRSANDQGIQLQHSTIGVLGGGGNIGQFLASELAPFARRIVLVGRPGRLGPLQELAARLEAEHYALSGLVSGSRTRAEVVVTDDVNSLADADLVVSATNSADAPLAAVKFTAKHRVVCDVAVPADAPDDLPRRHPGTRVVKGGLVSVPGATDLRIPGVPLAPGRIFACMAETLTLGLHPEQAPAILGTLDARVVGRLAEAAAQSGLELAETKTARSY